MENADTICSQWADEELILHRDSGLAEKEEKYQVVADILFSPCSLSLLLAVMF